MNIFTDIYVQSVNAVIDGFPVFLSGLLVLVIGLIVASALKKLLVTLFQLAQLDVMLAKAKLLKKGNFAMWEEILAEVLRWSVVILFLIPTLEIWGLSQATGLINEFILYLPNVFVAVVIAFIGLLAGNLVSDIVRGSVKTLGAKSANLLAVFSKAAITFFTVLVVLNQLGVAQDLIRILLTGIVGMLSLAGGLAFGLGGKEIARDLLENMRKKIK